MEKKLLSIHWSKVHGHYVLGSSDDGASEIIAWVSNDLVDMEEEIHFWIQKFNSVAIGEIGSGHLGIGNAHSVYAIGEYVFLECEYVDEMKVFLTRAQMVDALEKYEIFLSFDLENQIAPPPAFEVEYIASGEKAKELFLEVGRAAGVIPAESG